MQIVLPGSISKVTHSLSKPLFAILSTDKLVDCEAEGWGSSCITRVLKYTSTGNEIWLRSCVSPPPMTCDPGLDDSGAAGPVWTHCCDDDHCNDVDPRDELPTTTEVANTDGRMTLDIISGSLKL